MSRPNQWVMDASVGVKIFLQEPYAKHAESFVGNLGNDPSFTIHVPDLFYVECASILWKHVKRYGYSARKAQHNLEQLAFLGLNPVPTQNLFQMALNIALEKDITAYDACYVALSDLLGFPLLTADQKLVHKLKAYSHQVRWLGEWENL